MAIQPEPTMLKTLATAPISEKNRIEFLDVLRGIAVLFIFTMNIPFLAGVFFMGEEARMALPTHMLDEGLNFTMNVLAEGKFYSIFSLLFGIGFVVQMNSFKDKALFPGFFARRMAGLLLIGLIHIFFFWLGDILTLYALLGFLLILFRNLSDRALIRWAIVLILMPIAHMFFIGLVGFYPGPLYMLRDQIWASQGFPMSDWMNMGFETSDPTATFLTNSWMEFFQMNISGPLLRLASILEEGRAFKVLGIFLIGLWAGRRIINQDLLSNHSFLKKVAIWGFAIGIPMNVLLVYGEEFGGREPIWFLLGTVSYALGVVPLAMAYSAGIALWWKNGFAHGFLQFFAPVGRMALSNYLFQTLASIFLFFEVGFGLGLKFGYAISLCYVLGIFILQTFFSRWWLNNFRYGPMEWVWRQMTYRKILPNRLPKFEAVA